MKTAQLLTAALAAISLSCGSVRSQPPPAMPSAPELPVATVRVSRSAAFSPSCVVLNPGDTLEWRNLSPHTAISVLSSMPPYEISSPALLVPYNTVDLTSSDECVRRSADGSCAEALPYSYWRHRFLSAGVFDYQDASGGASGTSSGATDEYGMPVGPVTTGAASGTVCVRGASGAAAAVDCATVCCVAAKPEACGAGKTCVSGRCQAK